MKTFRTLCSGGELFGVGARAADWTHVDGYEIDPAIAVIARPTASNARVTVAQKRPTWSIVGAPYNTR